MRTLKSIISIGLLSSCIILSCITNANAEFTSINFYEQGAFSNDDFRMSDTCTSNDCFNDYRPDGAYYSTVNVSGCSSGMCN